MDTVRGVRQGLEIFEQLGFDTIVADDGVIFAGPEDGDVSADDRENLLLAGWTVGEFGWEINCD